MQVLVLLAALLFGGGLALYLLQHRLNHQVGTRAVTVAESVAQGSVVRRTVASGLPGGPHSPLATLAERVRQATGATIVIIANTAGARYADAGPMAPHHPPTPPLALSATSAADSAGPATTKISTEPAVLVQGGTVWGQAPIFSDRSVLAGEVAIGFPSSSAASPSGVPSILIGMAAGLVLGALASTVLSRRLFRQLLGLEPDELAVLLHERETTLHAIQEGVICLDAAHRVRFANNEASRMLDLPLWYPAEPLDELVPASRLHDALLGRLGDAETLLVVNEQVLIAEHTPIFLRGRQVGAVITIRDRTEPESLLRELDSVLGLTEALRAQAHEFSNRLHTLVGLVELGRYEDAVRFVTAVSISRNELTDVLVNRVHHSMVVALLLAKTTVAAERDVTLILDEKTDLRGRLLEPGEAVTVLGNLVDNAIDAAAGRGGDAWVRVKLATEGDGLLIEVADSGPGIPGTLVSSIFVDGFTTKGSTNGARRGLGLALVQQVVAHRRGTIDVGRGVGAVFSVVLPKCVTEPVGARGQGAEA